MSGLEQLYSKYRSIVGYGLLMGGLIFALKWLQWKFLIEDTSTEMYTGLIAVFFTLVGIAVASQLTRSHIKTVVVEKEVFLNAPEEFIINEAELKKLELTNREYEVLQQLAQGHSNAEIAENLFLSLSTVKTHLSNLFVKMEVKNRTQALEKAKRLKITP
ncbi:response regulator transcription factor [Telluribacter sp.]|jgi:DNA-binding CsgD family transcriptional regulator|uniref:response regulator transcription factor n=1 Tax=Telluribacter sp. TaxID=1978767 RepID=UPI002E1593E2|nr:response regulator transcription factor [Telluribacter sp.]